MLCMSVALIFVITMLRRKTKRMMMVMTMMLTLGGLAVGRRDLGISGN